MTVVLSTTGVSPADVDAVACGEVLVWGDDLGTMLHRYPDDLDRALNTWEARLRPFLDYYGTLARRQQGAIAPANQWQVKVNRGLLAAIGHPLVGPLLKRLASAGKEARMRSADIAAA